MSPLLVPVWAVGWWRLLRDPALATWRAFAVAAVLLVVVFMATGGKPYYVAGLYPVLLAAGGEPVAAWTRRGPLRTWVLGAAVVLSLAINAAIVLPVLPVTAIGVSNALKPDLAETKIYVDPPPGAAGGGHTFSRRVNAQTLQREDTPEQIDSWNRTWVFFEWYLRPYLDKSKPQTAPSNGR